MDKKIHKGSSLAVQWLGLSAFTAVAQVQSWSNPGTKIPQVVRCGQKKEKKIHKDTDLRDFPGGPVVKNLPSNAGDMGLIPGQGTKIPHATGQLSPRATTTEPARHN